MMYCWQTYNLDAQIGESSACATALLCGVKANFETVGLDEGGRFEDCYSTLLSKVDSLMVWAQQEGTYNLGQLKYYVIKYSILVLFSLKFLIHVYLFFCQVKKVKLSILFRNQYIPWSFESTNWGSEQFWIKEVSPLL